MTTRISTPDFTETASATSKPTLTLWAVSRECSKPKNKSRPAVQALGAAAKGRNQGMVLSCWQFLIVRETMGLRSGGN